MLNPTRLMANTLWYFLCLPGSLAYHRSIQNVAATQRHLLLQLLGRNAGTAIGRRYHFANIHSIDEYQTRLPLSTYEDYQEAIQSIGAGELNVLTRDPILMLEPTSGSTAATKYIPYTASLKAEFQRAIAPWIVDVYRHCPRLLRGQAYWSVTPIMHDNQYTPGGIPIGFEDDSEYFGPLQRYLIQSIMAVPPLVRLIDDMTTFRYITLLFLLRSRNLALISVWNPTFLILLMEPLADWWSQLADDIARGSLSPPAPLSPDLRVSLEALNRPDSRRATEIRAAFKTNDGLASIHAHLWPDLRLISCWTDAHAALYIPQLTQLFPQALVQGKGLLATEGVVSLPLTGYNGHGLAIRSHFFEFIPVGDDSTVILSEPPYLAHELEKGVSYEVILTTGGGLYRYRLGDIIKVVGHRGQCPLIQFVGKTGLISDRFGEKLHEHHVRQALEIVLARHNLRPDFAMLAYEQTTDRPAYVLFIEATEVSDQMLRQVGLELESALQENFHYRYCRKLGQLHSLGIFRITQNALATYLAVCRIQGQRAGDIKPVALHHLEGWSNSFQGRMLNAEVCPSQVGPSQVSFT